MAPRPEGIITPEVDAPEGPRVYQLTERDEIERDARVERNRVREERRDKGEGDVSEDEDTIPPFDEERPEDGSGDPAQTGHTASNGQTEMLPTVVGALSALSPNTLNRVNAFIKSVSSKPSSTAPLAVGTSSAGTSGSEPKTKAGSSPVEASDQEDLVMNEEDDFFIEDLKAPEPILALLRARRHVPLTICTTESLRKIRANETNNGPTRGASASKTGMRRGETTLRSWDLSTSRVRSPPFFKGHYEYLRRRKEMKTTFEAILEFDIEIRQIFFTSKRTRFIVGSSAYEAKLQSIRSDMVEQKVARDSKRQREPYQPYNKTDRRSYYKSDFGNSDRREGPSNKPFREGRQSSAGLLCLKCGQGAPNGHHAKNCRNDKLPNGRPTFTTFQNGILLFFWGIAGCSWTSENWFLLDDAEHYFIAEAIVIFLSELR
ncbi:hypothetical protein BDY19DRAFT_910955 [Irpex rosettiformis]|uniref:Uncharacterized protein n=1 Tax=Irpex rosettiformis TaxID=378272 RepID=A0ACB8TLT4_9APHY|nr:hypothetical protein BDY19DRAFT_910955 [Irpex rosettiformis]